MRYRALGRSGLQVSEIGFGTGDNAGLLVRGSEREQQDVVGRALELGITYFDTSPDYGKGLAETNLGRALKALRADNAIVCTKVEIMPDELVAGDIEKKIGRSIDDSLKRLGMDSVDVLMMHNAPRLEHDLHAPTWTPLTPEDFRGPALRALERARAAGKARYLGIACDLCEPAATKPLLEDGVWTVINMNYSLVNPTGAATPRGVEIGPEYADYDGVITHAGKHGVGVALIRPLAGGALTRQIVEAGAAGRHAHAGGILTRQPEFFAPDVIRGRAFAFLEKTGRSLAQAAFIFSLMNPNVTSILGGYSDRAQLEEQVKTSDMAPLDAAELAQIEAVYARNFDLATAAKTSG
jgi:aryl-alcohol dehydrogenase-like predicted oxidoreductase